MKKTKVYLGMPSTGVCADFQPYMLRELEKRYAEQIEFVYPEECAHRIFHDAARNGIVEDFLKTDCDILWFLDSDVVPPVHVLDLITKYGEQWDIAGAPYPIFMASGNKDEGRQVVFTAYKKINGGLRPTDIPISGHGFVDGLATGCLMIRREVFEKLTKPYFEFKFDPETRAPTEGEDLGFCRKAAEVGYQFFTDFSMVCKHYKNVELLEVNDYARLYAKKSVDAYSRATMDQVRKLEEMVKAKMAPKPEQKSSGLILPEHIRGY